MRVWGRPVQIWIRKDELVRMVRIFDSCKEVDAPTIRCYGDALSWSPHGVWMHEHWVSRESLTSLPRFMYVVTPDGKRVRTISSTSARGPRATMERFININSSFPNEWAGGESSSYEFRRLSAEAAKEIDTIVATAILLDAVG